MKFVQYLIRKLLPFFLGSLIFIALILNLVDLFMNISRYLEENVPAKQVLTVMLYYIPKTVWYAAPIAFLFSVTYILSDLYASNEMVALFASGISLLKFIIPILILGLASSFGMFFLEDKLVVSTLEKKQTLQKTLLGEQENANNDNIVVISDNSKIIYKAKRYRDSTKRLENVYFIFRDDEKNLEAIIFSSSALWNEEKEVWNLQNATQYTKIGDTLEITSVDKNLTARLTESYEIFRKSTVNIESVTVQEAKIYIEHLQKAGLPFYEQLSVYYKKFAFPFILFISGFLAVGVTGKTRKNVLLISLSLSIVAVVLFYVFQMITMVLAKTEVITPLMGAWLPDIVFTVIAVFLLRFSRT
ncbi:MAG: LptF/LptG family permease [Treponema sp.]|nr:LptF/LptG family permease [Treponema sp.]